MSIDAVIIQSLDGTVMSWDSAAERMFGYAAPDIVGKPAQLLVPRDSVEQAQHITERLRDAHPVPPIETMRMRKNGQVFPVSIAFSPITHIDAACTPQVVTLVGVSQTIREITARDRSDTATSIEQLFASMLLESLPGIVYLYTADGRFLRWSRSFERATGYSAAEIARLHPLDLFAPQWKPLVRERIDRALSVGIATVEAPLLAKDGTATPHFFTGRRIPFQGEACVVGMGVDVSERERAYDALRKSEERYRTTLESILEGCQLVDFDWHYLYLNDTAAVHNRRPKAELLGRTMQECWPGIETTHVYGMLERCLERRVGVHDETEFTFPDGSTGWFDVRAQPVPEGVFVLSIDITERKRAELALRELNESLELKVVERTRDLKLASERAESADRLKSAFLATMSHELRTPLNSIIGFSGILLQGLPGPLNAEQQKQLGMVQSSSRHLLDLINDVLDVSKIEAGQLAVKLSSFELRSSIDRMLAIVKPLAHKKNLALEALVPAEISQIHSDRRRVEQIILNLLNNAIKFTDHGGITLTVERRERELQLHVADTGIGIRPEDLESLFQPFRQIDAGLERQHEGTGLGLAICRRLSELLGGSIHVQSTWGSGSVFSLTLPLHEPGEVP
jgi:PAS domain S-box-containing protein